jgi:hypothetical protein
MTARRVHSLSGEPRTSLGLSGEPMPYFCSFSPRLWLSSAWSHSIGCTLQDKPACNEKTKVKRAGAAYSACYAPQGYAKRPYL